MRSLGLLLVLSVALGDASLRAKADSAYLVADDEYPDGVIPFEEQGTPLTLDDPYEDYDSDDDYSDELGSSIFRKVGHFFRKAGHKVKDGTAHFAHGFRRYFKKGFRPVKHFFDKTGRQTKHSFDKTGRQTKHFFHKTKDAFDKAGRQTKDFSEKAYRQTKDFSKKAYRQTKDFSTKAYRQTKDFSKKAAGKVDRYVIRQSIKAGRAYQSLHDTIKNVISDIRTYHAYLKKHFK